MKWTVYNCAWSILCYLAQWDLPSTSISKWIKVDRDSHLSQSEESILLVCASVGEYNRVLPIIDRLRDSSQQFEVAFYSISGVRYLEEVNCQLSYGYAPLDRRIDVKNYFAARNISQVIISSNLLWPNFLKALYESDIPYSFVGCSFYPVTLWQKWYFLAFRRYLNGAKYLFTIHSKSLSYLENKLELKNCIQISDPRVEQIIQQQGKAYVNSKIERWKSNKHKLLIVGSAYLSEIKILIDNYNEVTEIGYKILIAPHEKDDIQHISHFLSVHDIKYCYYEDETLQSNISIVKSYGILSRLYTYADYVIVGGGWNKGVHNVIEPLVHCVNVSIGPNYNNSEEIKELITNGIVQIFQSPSELLNQIVTAKRSETLGKKEDLRNNYLYTKTRPSFAICQSLGIS